MYGLLYLAAHSAISRCGGNPSKWMAASNFGLVDKPTALRAPGLYCASMLYFNMLDAIGEVRLGFRT